MSEVITFNFIVGCWKKKSYPEGFEGMLENYLLQKHKSFGNIIIKDFSRWLSHVFIAIEIGIRLDGKKFKDYKKIWESLTDRKWKVDMRKVEVIWKR